MFNNVTLKILFFYKWELCNNLNCSSSISNSDYLLIKNSNARRFLNDYALKLYEGRLKK